MKRTKHIRGKPLYLIHLSVDYPDNIQMRVENGSLEYKIGFILALSWCGGSHTPHSILKLSSIFLELEFYFIRKLSTFLCEKLLAIKKKN
jgi:hypothetical protein